MNEAILPYVPFLLPAATALAVFTVAVFAVSWLTARLAFALSLFRVVGAYLVRPSANAHNNADENVAYNSADPRSDKARNAVIGALFLSLIAWFALSIACMMLLLDPSIAYVKHESPSNTVRFAVIIAGAAIIYAAYRFLLMRLALKLSPEDFAAVRVKWKEIRRRAE